MFERTLNETERILATHKDVIVPMKELWLEVLKKSKAQHVEVPSLADFITLLEGDKRFEFLPAHHAVGFLNDSLDEDERELVKLGFFAEDRVKLRCIGLEPEFVDEETSSEIWLSSRDQKDLEEIADDDNYELLNDLNLGNSRFIGMNSSKARTIKKKKINKSKSTSRPPTKRTQKS